MTEQPSHESLLRHRDFVRGLAAGLLHDEQASDDVVQETFVTALSRPRRGDWPLAAWLGGIARNLSRRMLRERRRRTVREQAASRPEHVRSTAEVVASEEARQRVVAAVLQLPEPFRTTILLRYYDGLPPRAIARRLGVPGATVRSHLHRGLLRLRQQLDSDAGGQQAWRALLLPLAANTTTSATGAVRMFTMGKRIRVAAALLLTTMLAGGWLLHERGAEAPTAAPSSGGSAPLAVAADAPARTPAPQRVATGEVGPAVVVVGKEDHAPLPGAAVEVVGDDARTARGVTDAAGQYLPPWSGRATLWVGCEGRTLRRLTGVELGPRPVVVELGHGPAAQVRFVDEQGHAIEGAIARRRYAEAGVELQAQIAADTAWTEGGVQGLWRTMVGPDSAWRLPLDLRWTDAGAASAMALADGDWRLFVARPGATPFLSDAVVATAAEPTFTVPLPADVRMRRVRLLDAESGAPLAGATVTPYVGFGESSAYLAGAGRQLDALGEVDLPLLDGGRWQSRAPNWWATTATRAAQFMIDGEGGDGVLEVRVPRRGDVAGRAFGSDGTPAAGCEILCFESGMVERARAATDGSFALRGLPAASVIPIFLLDATATDGQFISTMVDIEPGATTTVTLGSPEGGARVTGRITGAGRGLPAMVAFSSVSGGGRRAVSSGVDGSFELAGVSTRGVHLQVLLGDPPIGPEFDIHSSQPLQLQPGELRRIDFDLPAGVLRLRVVDDASGAPIRGAVVMARPVRKDVQADRFPGFRLQAGFSARTGARGDALLRALPENELHSVNARADGYEPADGQAMPGVGSQPPAVELRLRRRS